MRHIPSTLAIAVATFAVVLVGCTDILVTPGDTLTVTRSISNVSRLDIANGFTVELSLGDTESLVIEAPEGFLPHIHTVVEGGVLRIFHDDVSPSTFSPKRAILTLKSLNSISASGGSHIMTSDTVKGSVFSIDLSGGSHVSLPMIVTTVNAAASGGSTVDLFGTAQTLNATDFSGGSFMHAFPLAATTVDVHASGGSVLEVRANGFLDVEASGGSKVYYKGKPIITKDLSGGSEVIDAN